jgi:hypothetical protein
LIFSARDLIAPSGSLRESEVSAWPSVYAFLLQALRPW